MKTKLLLLIVIASIGCSKKEITTPDVVGTLTDRDGNAYKTITIGSQTWMKENLKTLHLSDGTRLVQNDTIPGIYPAGINILYNGFAAMSYKLPPDGWRVPTIADFEVLINFLGGYELAGGTMKTTGTIQGTDGLWYDPNAGATDESGFSAIPAGDVVNGTYSGTGGNAGFWTTSYYLTSVDEILLIGLDANVPQAIKYRSRPDWCFSIRLIKN